MFGQIKKHKNHLVLLIIFHRVTEILPVPLPLPLDKLVPKLLTVKIMENVSPGKGEDTP
jgi:hypothetical protein